MGRAALNPAASAEVQLSAAQEIAIAVARRDICHVGCDERGCLHLDILRDLARKVVGEERAKVSEAIRTSIKLIEETACWNDLDSDEPCGACEPCLASAAIEEYARAIREQPATEGGKP